jgi:hypothetical protein
MTDESPRLTDDDVVDVLPADLDPRAFEGAYRFPDNSRRRVPAAMYCVLGLGSIFAASGDLTSLNGGVLAAGVGLFIFGLYGLMSGRKMTIDERAALVASQQAVGFAVGHASAQQVWRGVMSRPTWRVLAYSGEVPPRQRALVLVDAVTGEVIEHIVEDNVEEEVDHA